MMKLVRIALVAGVALLIFLVVKMGGEGTGASVGEAKPVATNAGATLAAPGSQEATSTVEGLTLSPSGSIQRESVAVSARGGRSRLDVELVALEGAGALPMLTVEARGVDWDQRISGRIGETLRFELPAAGQGTLSILESNSWLPDTVPFEAEAGSTTELALLAVPRRVIVGRVVDAATGAGIDGIRIANESILTMGPEGATSTYSGSFNDVETEHGRFALIPYQNAARHRLKIAAEGLATTTTEWFDVASGGRIDLGDIVLEPRDVAEVVATVVSSANGEPIAGAEVLLASKPISAHHLVISDGRVHSRVKLESRAVTDAEGRCTLEVEHVADKGVVVSGPNHRTLNGVLEASSITQGAFKVELEVGAELRVVAFVPPDLRGAVAHRRVEIRAGDDQVQVGLSNDGDETFEVATFGGLPLGTVEVRIVGDRIKAWGGSSKVLLANATVDVHGTPGQEFAVDLAVPEGRGVNGVVTWPAGIAETPLSALWYARTDQLVPDRGAPVFEGGFRLPGDSNDGLLTVTGLSRTQEVAFAWFASASDLELESTVSVDLGATELVGRHGPLFPETYEMVTITPAEGHPLFGAPGCTVRVFPDLEGDFRVFGLPPGPYEASADFTRKRASFELEGGRTRVELRPPL